MVGLIILAIIVILLLAYIISMKKELRNIADFVDKSNGEYVNININSNDKDIEMLVNRINHLYDENQRINVMVKKADEELKESIANMSHDLRTPLTSIMGYVELLNDDTISEAEKKEYLEIIDKRTRRLKKLISEFYDLSRLETNEYKYDLEKVDLRALLSENMALYYNDFINEHIEPVLKFEEVKYIVSDKEVIMRIFANLTSNILKHGNGQVQIVLKQEEDCIITEFINYAPYLEKNNVDKIFERFYIEDKSRNANNTGLGLSITKNFVEQLGNTIEAKLIDKKLHIIIRWKLANV